MSSRTTDILPRILVVLVVALVGVAAFYVVWPQLQPHATLRIGDGVFRAQIATTDTARSQGLSGIPQLLPDQALIIAYDSDSKWSVVMKDMSNSFDIVWTDQNKKIVYIVKNASPTTYPVTYTPNSLVRYVIGLPAGTVDNKSIMLNGNATFDVTDMGGPNL
jgi:uncharacterized membrane protein (UPF0127 family)